MSSNVKRENGLDSASFSSCFTLIGLQDEQRKEKRGGQKKAVRSAFVFYTAFPTDCVFGEGKGVQGGAFLLWMGPDTGLAESALPETRKCLEAHPQDLLFVFRLWHWLPRQLQFYTVMSLKKQYTKIICLLFFVYFCQKKKIEPNFKWKFRVSGIQEEQLKEFSSHALAALCGAVQFIHLHLFLHRSFPLPVSVLTLWEGYWIYCCSFLYRVNRCWLQKDCIIHD